MEKRDIAVIGGGLAGTAMAIALARAGFDTMLVAPPGKSDRRTTALIGSSMAFLDRIGLEDAVREKAEPLAVMRLIDDTGRLLRAPTVEFRATEIDLPAFGYNVLNADLADILETAANAETRLERRETIATSFEADRDRAIVTLDDGTKVSACLVIAADGRSSPMREAAGIKSRSWRYPQSALVLNISHAVRHDSISTEFHTETGPFTQVPMPGKNSAIVWVEKPERAELYVDLKTEKLERVIEDNMHSILGKVSIESDIQAFPLSGAAVERLTDERIALVGEAAHVFPPIGAQGLNLGLRDCSVLLDCLEASRDDPGRRSTLLRFDARRRADVTSRTAGVDALNRSLLTGFLPVQLGRSVGLGAMAAVSPLRRFAMREGVSPGAGLFGLPKSLKEWAQRQQTFGDEIK